MAFQIPWKEASLFSTKKSKTKTSFSVSHYCYFTSCTLKHCPFQVLWLDAVPSNTNFSSFRALSFLRDRTFHHHGIVTLSNEDWEPTVLPLKLQKDLILHMFHQHKPHYLRQLTATRLHRPTNYPKRLVTLSLMANWHCVNSNELLSRDPPNAVHHHRNVQLHVRKRRV